MLAGWDRRPLVEDVLLERQHLGQLQLVQADLTRPGQPIGAGVQAGSEQHDLAKAVPRGLKQIVVREPGSDHHVRPERCIPGGHVTDFSGGGALLGVEGPRCAGQEGVRVRVVEEPVGSAALLRPHHRHAECRLTHTSPYVAFTHRSSPTCVVRATAPCTLVTS